jgi:hypothetical protein
MIKSAKERFHPVQPFPSTARYDYKLTELGSKINIRREKHYVDI